MKTKEELIDFLKGNILLSYKAAERILRRDPHPDYRIEMIRNFLEDSLEEIENFEG